jgi:hypothetical protein
MRNAKENVLKKVVPETVPLFFCVWGGDGAERLGVAQVFNLCA